MATLPLPTNVTQGYAGLPEHWDAHNAIHAAIGAGIAGGIQVGFTAGRRYTAPGGTNTNQFSANGVADYVPFIVTKTQAFNGIAVLVTTAGSAGSVVRLGVYNDDGKANPGTLAFDAGTVATTATGLAEIAITQTLAVGLYWLTAASQGAAATQPIIEAAQTGASGLVGYIGTPTAGVSLSGYTITGITGALPTPATTPTGMRTAIARIFLKAA